MKSIKGIAAMSAILFASASAFGQSRDYIRQQIDIHESCKNVAITKTNGDLMLYGYKGWAAYGCPEALTDALHRINGENKAINDVVLTESGKWLVLYDVNGVECDGVPSGMMKVIRDSQDRDETITTATFNDDGDWIVITNDRISASDRKIQDWLVGGLSDYAALWSACLTNECIVAIYSGGYIFLGDVPEDLKEGLRDTALDVYRVKVAGTSWFFADKNGYYRYNM